MYSMFQVSSFVRAMLYDPEMRLNGGSVITYNPVPTAAAERSLLQAVYTLYSNGSLPGALQDIYAEQVNSGRGAGSCLGCNMAVQFYEGLFTWWCVQQQPMVLKPDTVCSTPVCTLVTFMRG